MSVKQCPQCGAPIAPNDTECRYCGEPFSAEKHSYSASKQQTSYSQTEDNYQYNDYHNYRQPPQNPYGTPQNPYVQSPYDIAQNNPAWPVKNKIAAGLLAIFLGAFGIHKFYLGQTGWGILYILFFWTGIPGFVGFIEGIIYLCSSDYNFQVMNHVRLR